MCSICFILPSIICISNYKIDGLVSKVFQQCKSIPSTNDRAVLSNQDGTGFDVDESSFSIGFNSNENQVQFNDAEGNNRKKDEREEIYGKENYLTMIEESAMAPETFPGWFFFCFRMIIIH